MPKDLVRCQLGTTLGLGHVAWFHIFALDVAVGRTDERADRPGGAFDPGIDVGHHQEFVAGVRAEGEMVT